MRRSLLLLSLVLCSCATAPPPPAVDAETRAAIAELTSEVTRNPSDRASIYTLAAYHAHAKQPDDAIRWLTRLDQLGWDHGIAAEDFRTLDTPEFRAVATRLDAQQPKVSRAVRAFTLAGHSAVVPEGITWDPVDDVFYVSGIQTRNVLRVDRSGNPTEFVKEAQDGMLSGLGLKVDAERRLLWVISTTTRDMRGYQEGPDQSMLAAYDLRNGQLVRKIDATPAWLNDLVLMRDGSLFATDTMRGKVMHLPAGADALEIWAEGLKYPNGIESDGTTLYVADSKGLHEFDIAGRTRRTFEANTALAGIDGLSLAGATLIGIQNALGAPRVIRIDLASATVEVLESKNDVFEIPTTGVVARDGYYFIANPGLRAAGKVGDPVMLRIPL
jgi:sugar lactone lactonase YvrE